MTTLSEEQRRKLLEQAGILRGNYVMPTLTEEQRQQLLSQAGLSRLPEAARPSPTTPEAGPTTSPLASQSSLPPLGAPAAVAQPAAGTPLPGVRPGQPGFIDPYGLGPFINLEQPGGPEMEPARYGGPPPQGTGGMPWDIPLGALDVIGASFQALTQWARPALPYLSFTAPVTAPGTTPFLAPTTPEIPPRPEAGVFERLVEAERQEPLVSQIVAGALTDPTTFLPGIGLMPSPGSFGKAGRTGAVAQAVTPPPAAIAQAAPPPPPAALAQAVTPSPAAVAQAAPTPPMAQIGKPGALKNLPPDFKNYREPLSTYTDRLFRETDAEEVMHFADPATVADTTHEVWLSNTPDLALSQRGQKGYTIEYEPGAIRGQINTAKPGWDFAYGQGGTEFRARLNHQDVYRDAVVAIRVAPGVETRSPYARRFQHLVDGILRTPPWPAVKNADGSTTYLNPAKFPSPAQAAPMPPVAQAAGAVTPPGPVQRGMPGVPDRTITAESPNVLQGNLDELIKRQEWGSPAAAAPTPVQQAEWNLHAAQQELDVLEHPGAGTVPRAPKFGSAERAEWEVARRGKLPRAQQIAQARRATESAQQNLLRLQNEVPAAALPQGAGPPPVAGGVGPQKSFLRRVEESQLKGDRLDQTALRLHEAGLNNAQRTASQVVAKGNERLARLRLGAPVGTSRAARPQDIPVFDNLYEALHSPSRVAAGEIKVPAGLEDVYTELRQAMDWESLARLDFDPEMATVDDYFYRGWKPPAGRYAETAAQKGKLVTTPAFQKPRVNATYREMRDLGFEPLHWNPYEQWRIARMQGERYRQQMELVDALKGMGDEVIRPDHGGPLPTGWRTPQVGPAFEGKPFAGANPATGESQVMYTQRWIAPDRVANVLESMYGKKPNMGKVTLAGRTADIGQVVDWVTFMPKRAKLVGSFFQQMDFLTRTGVGSWTGMVDALYAGKPLRAVKHLAMYPKTAGEMLVANFSPAWRSKLMNQLDETKPLLAGRLGVSMKAISDAGLSIKDVSILPPDMDTIVREIAQEATVAKALKAPGRAVASLESAMRRGLFEGVYPAAILNDVRYNIAPTVAHLYPKLTDEQLASRIAVIANKKYSTIPASQSLITNRTIREGLRRVFFSMNESEGLLRQAAGAIGGPEAAYWRTHWLAAYLFLLTTAGIIHYASTGKMLPTERFTPVSKDPYSPLGIGYNTKFASPDIPLKGRGGVDVTLDLVGQLDTAFRVLNPATFISSRISVPLRAAQTQLTGKDFFGAPVDDVGPGGVVSRTVQLALELFSPIGAGQAATEIARAKVPGAADLLPEGESRLGVTGNVVQATGVNLRTQTTPDLLNAKAQEMWPGRTWKELEPYQKDVLTGNTELGKELQLRTETSAERGLPSSQYAQRRSELETWRDTEVDKLSKSPKSRSARANKQDKRDILDLYYDIETEYAVRKREASRMLGDTEYEDVTVTVNGRNWNIASDSIEDPNQRALSEYYAASEVAKTLASKISGTSFSEARDSVLESLEKNRWSAEQKGYVARNTNMTEVPPEIFVLFSDKSKKRYQVSQQARQSRQSLQ